MATQRYMLRKISTLPLARFGCVLGGVAMLLPGIVCALIGVQGIAILRTFLENLEGSEMNLLGAPVELDFIAVLGLETLQALVSRLDDQRFIVALLIILVSILGGGFLIGLIILLLGWSYNILAALTGGLEVELRQ